MSTNSCICGGAFPMTDDGHAIDCPAGVNFKEWNRLRAGQGAQFLLSPKPGRDATLGWLRGMLGERHFVLEERTATVVAAAPWLRHDNHETIDGLIVAGVVVGEVTHIPPIEVLTELRSMANKPWTSSEAGDWINSNVGAVIAAIVRLRVADVDREAIKEAMSPHGWLGEQCIDDIVATMRPFVARAPQPMATTMTRNYFSSGANHATGEEWESEPVSVTMREYDGCDHVFQPPLAADRDGLGTGKCEKCGVPMIQTGSVEPNPQNEPENPACHPSGHFSMKRLLKEIRDSDERIIRLLKRFFFSGDIVCTPKEGQKDLYTLTGPLVDPETAGDGVEDRDAIAAAVANFDDMEAFRDWAANHSTYPNAYKSSVDRTYAIADRVAAALARPRAAVETVEFVREWLMSSDHPVSDWERQFAAAIDARPPAKVER